MINLTDIRMYREVTALKERRLLCFILIFSFCAAALSGCSLTKELRETAEYMKHQETLLSEDTDWIDTQSKLAMVVMEDFYFGSGEDKGKESQDVFRTFDFVNGTHADREITLGYTRHLVPRNAGPGFAILEYGKKQYTLYEVLDDLSIGRKTDITLNDVYSVYGLVDDKLYYQSDENDGSVFGGDFCNLRQNLSSGKVETLDISVFHCVDDRHNVIGQRTTSIERLAKDGKTILTESIYELGILDSENKWTPIVKAGWECPYDNIESACWLNENTVLIAMSPSDKPDVSLYVWDMRSDQLSRLVTDSSEPIFPYGGWYIDRTMYPDPSGEYIAYFIYDWSAHGTLDSIDSVCVLSLKTGQVSRVEGDKHTKTDTEEMYHDLCVDILLWQ